MGRKFKLAEKLAEFYPNFEDRKNVKILDIAAGTGLAGVGLLKQGFKNFDAIGKKNKKSTFRKIISSEFFLRWISSHVRSIECQKNLPKIFLQCFG